MKFIIDLKALTIVAAAAAAALATSAAPAAAQFANPYLRFGLGLEQSEDAIFLDRDCNSTLAVLFGCGPGVDGLPRAARGDFGRSTAYEFGVGWEALSFLRLELMVGYRPNFAFAGEANFDRTPGEQPVHGDLTQFTGMGFVYVDLLDLAGRTARVQPYVGFGAGLAVNVMGPMLYEFPGFQNQPYWALTPGGTANSFAWAAVIGLSIPLSERATLDLALRHTNYGIVRTDVGPLIIRHGGNPFSVDIDETRARLITNGVSLSLRWAL